MINIKYVGINGKDFSFKRRDCPSWRRWEACRPAGMGFLSVIQTAFVSFYDVMCVSSHYLLIFFTTKKGLPMNKRKDLRLIVANCLLPFWPLFEHAASNQSTRRNTWNQNIIRSTRYIFCFSFSVLTVKKTYLSGKKLLRDQRFVLSLTKRPHLAWDITSFKIILVHCISFYLKVRHDLANGSVHHVGRSSTLGVTVLAHWSRAVKLF